MVIESNVAGAAGKPGTRLFGDHVSDQNSVLASFGGVAVADRRGRTRRRNDPSRYQPETSAPTPTPPGRVGSQRSIGELAGCRRSHELAPETPNQPRNPRSATWQSLRMPLGVTTSLPPPAPNPGRNGPRQTRVGSQRSIGELAGCRRSHEPPPKRPISQETPETPLGSSCECHLALPRSLPATRPQNPVETARAKRESAASAPSESWLAADAATSSAPKTPNQPRNPRNATWQFVPMSIESPHTSSPTWHTCRTRLSPCRTRCTKPGISL